MPARIRSQLAIQLPPVLRAELRALATAQGRTVTALVLGWIRAGVASAAPSLADGPDPRLAALEARVTALEARPVGSPLPPAATPSGPPVAPPAAALESGRLTTAQLAVHLGIKRGTLNARLNRRKGAEIGTTEAGWRCVDRVAAAQGGPPQWVWEQDTPSPALPLG